MSSFWWSRRAIVLHVALALAVPSFLAMGFWQLRRALSGNMLSWAYTFEWPFFAAYATWMWWKLLHDTEAEPAESMGSAEAEDDAAAAGATAAVSNHVPRDDFDPYDERDPELAAYNRYLAELNASDKPKRW
ncbi:MAG TPA: hypothetical protein VKA05_01800 [Acidimicrobiales bacterium]|nr:hypothetical protein [Acidimicrobiales bacterium]